MRKVLLFFTLLVFSFAGYTQQMTEDGKCLPPEPMTSGMVKAIDDIGDFTIVDSDGITHNLYNELDAGNTVLIDLFFTT
jgi:cytochrome oxidase Cu insertion factor (SCO1/SenC/PrrC family)